MRRNVPRCKAVEIQEANDHWTPGAFEAGHEKKNVETLGSVLRSFSVFYGPLLGSRKTTSPLFDSQALHSSQGLT